jgi:predicted nucleotidyltransferase
LTEKTVLTNLAEIEEVEGVRIVYACESGSRAWGFPSADSDYDVRFIYARPVEWYLSIENRRDVIERPISNSLDISGWDLRKALQLLRKSNPPLLEWLNSPIVYVKRYSTLEGLRAMQAVCYSPNSCAHHYLNMARGNFREHLQGQIVWVKKYFYVLRPVLAMQWIERGMGVVPTDFNVLVRELITDQELLAALERLLARKKAGAELDNEPRIEAISRFIEGEITRWAAADLPATSSQPSSEMLDRFFRDSLTEIWSD